VDKSITRKILVKCNLIHGQSPVSKIYCSQGRLLSLSLEDQAIILSNIKEVNKKTEPYFFLKDPIKKVFEKHYALKYELTVTEPVQSQLTNSDSMSNLKFLKLQRQLGKQRNPTSQSLLYLPRSQLVSVVGKKIIFYYKPQTSEQQISYFESKECVFSDESLPNLKQEEIACVSISLNRQLFAISYKNQHCLITVWDFDGKGLLGSRQLGSRLVTQDMTFTENSHHLICLLFKQSGYQELVIIKLSTMDILNRLRFDYWLSFKIRGLYTIKSQQFYTFGFQHLYLWTFSENLLDFEILNLESLEEKKENFVDHYNSEEYFRKNKNFSLLNNEGFKISFFSTITTMKVINSLLVTATDDGYILFWVRNKLVKRHLGHTNSVINAIDFCIFDDNCKCNKISLFQETPMVSSISGNSNSNLQSN
jgi:hypothetical protein